MPINISATGQAKQGGLILNTGGSANGLIVQSGNVGIGTTNPQAQLDVAGNINASGNISSAAPTASNHLATKGYVDAASGGGAGGGLDGWYDSWCPANQGSLCAKVDSTEYVCNGNYCIKTSKLNDVDGDGKIGWYDCDDSNVNIKQATDNSCDGDGDGHIDYTAGGDDYYDNDYTKTQAGLGQACTSDAHCSSGLCGTDADNDNYLSIAAGHTGTCKTAGLPVTDCYDSNANAYPGQSATFTVHRGDGSFDYNCNGSEDKVDCDNAITCAYNGTGGDCGYGTSCDAVKEYSNCGQSFTQFQCYYEVDINVPCQDYTSGTGWSSGTYWWGGVNVCNKTAVGTKTCKCR